MLEHKPNQKFKALTFRVGTDKFDQFKHEFFKRTTFIYQDSYLTKEYRKAFVNQVFKKIQYIASRQISLWKSNYYSKLKIESKQSNLMSLFTFMKPLILDMNIRSDITAFCTKEKSNFGTSHRYNN